MKILDQTYDALIAENIEVLLEELGYPPELAIPGLVLAIKIQSIHTPDPDQVLNEVAELLDGEVEGA